MSETRKIKAANIKKLGSDFESISHASLPTAGSTVDNIGVGFPGFSVLGLPLLAAHEVFKNQSKENITNANRTMEKFKEALDDTAATWADAEDKSAPSIKY